MTAAELAEVQVSVVQDVRLPFSWQVLVLKLWQASALWVWFAPSVILQLTTALKGQ